MSTVEKSQNKETSSEKRTIVVTGFGLFRNHESNPSWESIRDGRLKIDREGYDIVTKRIDVAYKEVDKAVDDLWKQYKPKIMVHVGLAAHETGIKLEQMARCGPYIHDDVVKHAPHKELREYVGESLEENLIKHTYYCKPCEFDCSTTCLDLDHVCFEMNKAHEKGLLALPTKTSQDAGLYVCEYIYHKSLSICDRAVFIHVPDVKKFKLEDITSALKFAIETLIDSLD